MFKDICKWDPLPVSIAKGYLEVIMICLKYTLTPRAGDACSSWTFSYMCDMHFIKLNIVQMYNISMAEWLKVKERSKVKVVMRSWRISYFNNCTIAVNYDYREK